MRRSSDFSSVVRSGRRARRGAVVVHQLHVTDSSAPPVVGFVVGRSVGISVVRHRVTRRLRAEVAQRLESLPAGTATVVRALPDSAEASSSALGHDLAAALARLSSGPSVGVGSPAGPARVTAPRGHR